MCKFLILPKENSPIGEDRGVVALTLYSSKISNYVEFASSWKFILSYSARKTDTPRFALGGEDSSLEESWLWEPDIKNSPDKCLGRIIHHFLILI